MTIPHGYDEIVATYGNPHGENGQVNPKWQAENIVGFIPPYPFIYVNDNGTSVPVTHFQVHKMIVTDLSKILANVMAAARELVKANEPGQDTAYYDKRQGEVLAEHRVNVFGGAFVYRNKRGQDVPSCHGFGIAIDFDPAHNAFGSQCGTLPDWFIKAFTDEGWEWGGQWTGRDRDWMHMQRAQGY